MRKFIVKHFSLGTWVRIFGKNWHFLRAARIIFPVGVFAGLVISVDPAWPAIQWWDVVVLFVFAVTLWLGFGGLLPNFLNYWHYNPVHWSELDEEQQQDYMRAIDSLKVINYKYGVYTKLDDQQKADFNTLTRAMELKFLGKKTAQTFNLIPLGIGVFFFIIAWLILEFNLI